MRLHSVGGARSRMRMSTIRKKWVGGGRGDCVGCIQLGREVLLGSGVWRFLRTCSKYFRMVVLFLMYGNIMDENVVGF